VYLLEQHRILGFTEKDSTEIPEGILYGPFRDIRPLEFELVRTSFTYPDPYILLTEAQRSIEISHWGNI
jgi:hypothetical protein